MPELRIKGEKFERHVQTPRGREILIVRAWHYMDTHKKPDTKYHYAHAYLFGRSRPLHSWRWVEFSDGTWEWV